MQFQLIVPGNQMTTAEGSFDRVLYYFLNIWQPKEGKGSPNKIDIIWHLWGHEIQDCWNKNL